MDNLLKYSIYIFIFIFSTLNLFGQYQPMAVEGNYWMYRRHLNSDFPEPIGAYVIRIGQETMINGEIYKEVIYSQLAVSQIPCPSGLCISIDIPYRTISDQLISHIREDELNRKVYNRPVSDSNRFCQLEEYLLFDFDLNVGERMDGCARWALLGTDDDLRIGNVDSIKVTDFNGSDRRTIYTFGSETTFGLAVYDVVKIVEGLGYSIAGIFPYLGHEFIRFCSEDDSTSCQLITNVSFFEPETSIEVYPNPTYGIFNIDIPEGRQIEGINVLTMNGVSVKKVRGAVSVDIGSESAGVYLLEVSLTNGTRFAKKIIKTN